ncbi:hypothetical protein CTEN210_05048 [Chaetoceros tenuissimus]|uniref:Methyltransferase FkbM domain-containing protein n=1 Tax=Chaetoceros tenuissimus TaxID=426638 RepID=A0AAD3H2V4_9STRA|nr:hypothetical protein CTEN210_05048 [Chaetoceros tenuissimus]
MKSISKKSISIKSVSMKSISMKYAIVLYSALSIMIICLFKECLEQSPRNSPTKSSISQQTKKLGDGCYHVFLDVGANIGVHGRFIYEPEKYPRIKPKTREIFYNHFGNAETRDPRDICVFAFEPNPAHIKRHKDLEKAYKAYGIRYFPVAAGVSDIDGNLTFYHQGDKDLENNEWGFSTTRFKDSTSAVNVPVLRLRTWLEEHIDERQIPSRTFGGEEALKLKPLVVMKVDIEGSEFKVFPDLIGSGILCKNINYIFGEWHNHTRGGYSSMIIYNEWDNHLIAVMNMFVNVDGCKLEKFDYHDDECYHLDGMPLPSPGGNQWWGN